MYCTRHIKRVAYSRTPFIKSNPDKSSKMFKVFFLIGLIFLIKKISHYILKNGCTNNHREKVFPINVIIIVFVILKVILA